MGRSRVTGYEETDDPYARLMYEAGWVPAPRLDRWTQIPRVSEPGAALIIGGKPYVPGLGTNVLRGSVLRRYIEAYTGPMKTRVDYDSFMDSAQQLGIMKAKQITPVSLDPIPSPAEDHMKMMQNSEYEDTMNKARKATTMDETRRIWESFRSRWR